MCREVLWLVFKSTCFETEKKRAVDGVRTRDLRLGKPTLYQLSYYRNLVLKDLIS